MKALFYTISSIIVVLFIIIAVLVHSHPTANPTPLYYFALPFMIAKIYCTYLLINKPVVDKELQELIDSQNKRDEEWNKYWLN